ncbi:MAG: class I SAM-dependent methyltransferase [Proteobacteria bacterium]|nr:class I SAM-dependent methyltransferase [Pseudomonadota bacterium]
MVAHGTPPDPVQRELIEATRTLGPAAIMQIAPEQGAFLEILTRLLGASRAIEVGTFTGYSALCIARGLPETGQLLCCDVSEEWTSMGRRFWEKAGVAHKIRLELAPAADTLRALPTTRDFDLAFIDADKPNYPLYYEECLKRIRPGGVVLVDNVLWSGRVADPDAQDENTRCIRDFNDRIARDERVDRVMLSIADGLTLLRVRDGSGA